MIVGTGIDFVEVERIKRIHEKYTSTFAKRILCEAEFEEYIETKSPERFLAKRFAAKEAVVKALGTGFARGVSLKMICIDHDELGRPSIKLYDGARQRADQLAADVSWISITDEKSYAVAFVVMESRG